MLDRLVEISQSTDQVASQESEHASINESQDVARLQSERLVQILQGTFIVSC